ncbi:MAG: hypothetical protein ABUK03_05355, partial [Dehalococcoidales bacterium]
MVWLKFVIALAIIIFAGTRLARYGDAIAEKTGLGRLWIGLILLAAITSAMMSTVDSLLIVAGSALSYDLFQNLVHPGATERQKVVVGR